MLAQIGLGGCMIALPIYLQMVFEYNALQAGISLAPLSLSTFAVALIAGRKAGDRRPSAIIRVGFALVVVGVVVLLPIIPRADDAWALVIPLLIIGSGLGLLVSQLNNYTLAPVPRNGSARLPGSTPRVARSASRSVSPLRARSCWPRSRSSSPTWPATAPCSPRPSRSGSPTRWKTTPR